jgi:hypothetical protein
MNDDTSAATEGRPSTTRSPEEIIKDLKGLLSEWFFKPDSRKIMVQAIVGGLIANLLTAVILLGTGTLRISFSWSLSFYLLVLYIIAAIFVLVGIGITVSYHHHPENGRAKAGWGESIGVAVAICFAQILLWPAVVAFIEALHISIHHTTSGVAMHQSCPGPTGRAR